MTKGYLTIWKSDDIAVTVTVDGDGDSAASHLRHTDNDISIITPSETIVIPRSDVSEVTYVSADDYNRLFNPNY